MIPLALSYIVVRRFSDRVKRVYEAVRARLGDIGTFVHDRLAGIQLAQSFAQIDREKLAFRGVTQSYYEQSVTSGAREECVLPGGSDARISEQHRDAGNGYLVYLEGRVYCRRFNCLSRLLVAPAKPDKYARPNDRYPSAGQGRCSPGY